MSNTLILASIHRLTDSETTSCTKPTIRVATRFGICMPFLSDDCLRYKPALHYLEVSVRSGGQTIVEQTDKPDGWFAIILYKRPAASIMSGPKADGQTIVK